MKRTGLRAGSDSGFTVVELMISLGITLAITSTIFLVLDPAGGAFQTQPEAADVQQRTRVATDMLSADLMAAGSGPWAVLDAAGQRAAAVFPFRVGRTSPDPAGSFSAQKIAVWYVSPTAPQAILAAPLLSASGVASIILGPGCVAGDASCGFRAGRLVGVFGPDGAWDLFSVTGVAGPLLTLQHDLRDAPITYPAGETAIAEVTVRSYFSKDDRVNGMARLMRYDGAGGGDIPVVDHVVRFDVEYFAEPEPPAVVAGMADEGDRLTYGPAPPPVDVQRSLYPPGENCAFVRTAGGAVTSRLSAVGTGPALVPIGASSMTDGPWCPDAANPNRYDADLLRIRSVSITLAVEAAIPALRGPAGPLFTRGGTARGNRLVPDRRVRIAVAPRAIALNH